MKKFNISKPEKYTKDGVEMTYWANVGSMTEFTKDDGSVSRIIEIPAIGLKANVFPIDNNKAQAPKQADTGYQEGEADPNDIPF